MQHGHRFKSQADYNAHLAEQQRLNAVKKAAAKRPPQGPGLAISNKEITLPPQKFIDRFESLREKFIAGQLATVRIDDPLAGLAADFNFDRQADTTDRVCVTTRDLRRQGVAACLARHDQVVVLDGQNRQSIGILKQREMIAPDLQAAANAAGVQNAKPIPGLDDYRCPATRINSLILKWNELKEQGKVKPGQGVPLLSGQETVARAWDPHSQIPTTGVIDMTDVHNDSLRFVFAEHAAVRLNPWPRSRAPKNPVTPDPDTRLIITGPDYRPPASGQSPDLAGG